MMTPLSTKTMLWQVESWKRLRPALTIIYEQEHLPETAPFPGKLSTTLDVAFYDEADALGKLFILTGREPYDGTLVAYYTGILTTFPSTHTPYCANLLYFVRKPWRGQGIGYCLFLEVEDALRARGIHIASAVVKDRTHDGEGLLQALDYTPEEMTYLKWIREDT